MRLSTCLTMIVAPLALAACGSEEEAEVAEMPMTSEGMPMAEGMAMDGAAMTDEGAVGQIASGQGTVTAIDVEAGTITIDHGPVEAVGWPAMNMAFGADESLQQQVAVGDEVAFEFRVTPDGSTITAISPR